MTSIDLRSLPALTALAAVAATAANLLVLAVAGAAGVDVRVPDPATGVPADLGVVPVAVTSVLAAVAAGVAVAVLNRFVGRPRTVFLTLGAAGVALSMVPLVVLDIPGTGSRLALAAMHLLAGAVVLPLVARAATARRAGGTARPVTP